MSKIDDAHSQEEMGFFDHIDVLRWHILRSVIAVLVFGIVAFVNKSFIFDFLIFGPTRPDFPTNRAFCWLGRELPFLSGLCMESLKYNFINTDLSGQFMLHIQTSAIAGFVFAFPYIFWEFWRFIKPALHERELKNANFIVFFTSILFLLGCLFGYFIIAPFSINFLYSYEAIAQAQNMIEVENYINTIVSMVIPTGIMFELPMLVYFLTKFGVITPKFMKESRKIAYVVILFVIAVITPQGDMFSLLLISAPIFTLYEISINISSNVFKSIVREEEESF
jgi:sec-independent protein translocase protein TatC